MSRVFFDTNIFVYLFEDYEPMSSRVDAIWRSMVQRRDQLVTSTMTMAELLVKPTKLGQTSMIEEYERAIRSRAQIISFDMPAARIFSMLRATQTIRQADAIQLACAATFGVDLFLTNDLNLHKLQVPGIGFITPLEKVPM